MILVDSLPSEGKKFFLLLLSPVAVGFLQKRTTGETNIHVAEFKQIAGRVTLVNRLTAACRLKPTLNLFFSLLAELLI
jgi:hypothetical protein